MCNKIKLDTIKSNQPRKSYCMKKSTDSKSYDKKTSFSYFLSFFRYQIDHEALRQNKIAGEIGVRPEYINRIYKGKQTCSVDVQERICRFFSISYLEALALGKQLLETNGKPTDKKLIPGFSRPTAAEEPVKKTDLISETDIISVITHWTAEKRETENTLLKLQNIIENLSEGVVILDTDLIIQYQNRSHREMFGSKTGKKCSITHECKKHIHECPCKISRRTSMPANAEFPYSGSIVSATTTPIRDFSGVVTGYVTVLRDITKRKDTERSLIQSNEILERIFSTTHFCIVYLDNKFNFIRVNRAYADACGHPPEFFPGKNLFDLYPDDESEAIFQQVVDFGEPFTINANPFKFPYRPKRGKTYWDWTLSPVFGHDQQVEGLLFTLIDVTNAEKADQERSHLEAERQKLLMMSKQAVEMFDYGVFILDEKLNIRLYNSKFKEITGATAEDLRTVETFRAYVIKNNLYENYDKVVKILDEARKNYKEANLHIRTNDGSTYLYNSKPMYVNEDTYIGRMAMFKPLKE